MITKLTLSSACCPTYPLQHGGQDLPALSPEPVTLERFPLGQCPSLHCLRNHASGFVRQLRRYYWSVRVPVTVHHRATSLDFPMRSVTSLTDSHGISRFPLKVLACMPR